MTNFLTTKIHGLLKQLLLVGISVFLILGHITVSYANPYPNNQTNPTPVAVGIDVSKYNRGKIDWNAVKKAGFSFVIIKISKRNSETGISDLVDEKFEEFYAGAGAAGLKRGVYVFNYASDVAEAELEAEACLEALAGRPLELPIAYDVENYSSKTRNKLTKKGKTVTAEALNTFCDIVEDAGYQSMIYTGTNFIKKYIDYDMISDRRLWLARYPKVSQIPTYQDYMNYNASEFPYYIWQFSSLAYVPTASYTTKSKGKTIHHCDVNFIYDPAFADPGIDILRNKTLQNVKANPDDGNGDDENLIDEYDVDPVLPNNTAESPAPTAMYFNEAYINLDANNIENYKLNLSVFPAGASLKELRFLSSDTEIATVDHNGTLTPKKSGTVIITASSGFINASATINITKDIVSPTSISLNENELLMTVGESRELYATVTPQNISEVVKYSSSDPAIVTVDDKGKITALKEGEAVILATIGSLSEECDVIVEKNDEEKKPETSDKKKKSEKKKKKEENSENENKKKKNTEKKKKEKKKASKPIDIVKSSVSMGIGEQYKFEVILQNNINANELGWYTSDTNIVSGYDSGVMIAKSKGKAVLTAKLKTDPSINDSVTITVTDNPTSISLGKKTLSLKKGETYKLKPKFNKGEGCAKLSYQSSDSKIVKVSKNGNLRAMKKGTVMITVTTYNKKTSTVKITVK